MDFKLTSAFVPSGDQPEAISALTNGVRSGEKYQILLGVTGSGKTFTIANVIANLNLPTLILSHNKTLAAQLYGEFRHFFPENSVQYFVSYYDYFQPEAYLPTTDTYIEKDLAINDELEKLRLSTTSALLSGRRDVIVVSSVSCLYGIGNPQDFFNSTITLEVGQKIARNAFLRHLVDGLYARNEVDFKRGTFRVRGDTVDIYLAYSDHGLRVIFWGDEIETLELFDPTSGALIEAVNNISIYPANIFVVGKERMQQAIRNIQDDLVAQVEYFKDIGRHLEAKRLEQRVEYDLEMIRELGYCPGIENYSRYFDGRSAGMRPFCLLDYFPRDFLLVVDESHVTIPQIRAMYGGDHSRKANLVEYGFRLPAAVDNRPLRFDEFDAMVGPTIYMSATPADFELQRCGGVVVDQVVRPTGLLDPVIYVRPAINQVDNLVGEINAVVANKQRALVTTLTKRMAEELAKYLHNMGIRVNYIHSDVDTMERVQIMEDLRNGKYDVLVGVNLLREGLDLPEVSLVAILDADKEGFLRSTRSLTQTAGRAARNVDGRVIMYADKITQSMQTTIDETNRRREKQLKYNELHGITPTPIVKERTSILGTATTTHEAQTYAEPEKMNYAAEPVVKYMTHNELLKAIDNAKHQMEKAAKELNFVEAARFRDEMFELKKMAGAKITDKAQ